MADLKTTNIYGDAYINNKVGINTNTPATRLQIGQLSPTAATEGLQFGDDTAARLHRINSGHIRATGGISSATFLIADNYLQTNNNLIYPSSQAATQRLEVGNSANNAWIDGITIAPGGNVNVYNNLSSVNGYVYAGTYLQSGNSTIYAAGYGNTLVLNVGNASGNNWINGIAIAQGGNVTVYNNLTVNNNATVTNDLTVNGNTYLGNANNDTVYVNDTIRIGATDSGDASLFFGEGAVAGSDYGARWYWDSGYTFTWYTRNAGTDTALFDYVTNDTSYLNWRRNFHMQNKEINYNAQIHFNAGTRFVGSNTSYLIFRSDSGTAGGIQVQDGSATNKGYTGYWDSGGGGILNNTGNWAVRYNFGGSNSGGTLYGTWDVTLGFVVAGNVTAQSSLLISGSYSNNPYDAASGARLLFGGGNSDALGNYFIGTNLQNFGGNYNKLDISWHTGIRLFAQTVYGGIRFYNASYGNSPTNIFSVGEGDNNVRVANELFVGTDGIGAYKFMKYGGIRSGDWQLFTTSSAGAGQMNVVEVQNIAGGSHSNYPTGVYTYGGVMSWRLPNHSFQLYAAHTGDLAYKTQWGNDNYSGWRRILDSTNYSYAASMNQNVTTTSNPTFGTVTAALSGNATTATTLQTARAINGVSFNGSADITVNGLNYNVNNVWLRENGDDAQFQMYGNSRTMIYRTDGNTNPHGGGAFAHIFYYGGSADGNRTFIINTDGRLWSPYHGWLDTMSTTGNAGNVSISNLNTQQVSISLAAGSWYTIAANDSNRASAKFTITDTTSGLHQAIHFYATAHYGNLSGAKITVVSNTYYGGPPVSAIRIMTGGTYDGAMVQIYALSACNLTVSVYDNQQSSGWVIKSGVVSTTNPGTVSAFANLTTIAASADLTAAKSFTVSDDIFIGGATTQYKALHVGNYNSYAPSLTGANASGTWSVNITGNAATATTTDNINGRAFFNRDSGNVLGQDSYTNNGIGYVNGVSLYGQSDGGMHASAYSTSWIHQIYGDFRTGQIAIRGKNNGTWQAWRAVLDDTNYTGYTVTKTGTGASGDWGINITGNAATATTANALNTANSYTGVNIIATGYLQSNSGNIKSDTSFSLLTTGNSAQTVSAKGILLGTSYDTTPNANEIRTTNNTSLYLNARGTGDIQFQTNDSTKVTLLNSGNLGIGITAPAALLHVYSTDSRFLTYSGLGGLTIQKNAIVSGGATSLWLINTQGTDFVNRGTGILFSLGYGGSGTSVGTIAPGGKIVLLSETGYSSNAADQNAYLAFYTATAGTSTEKMRISSGGNVTITGTISASNLSGTNTGDQTNISGNAATAGGLAVQAGTNYEANKIVRTDGNGYILAGWINTISGDNGTTAIDRVYASSDGYIRYYTPANFRTVLDVPTRTGGGVTNFGINVSPSNRLHVNGDGTNPAIRVDNGAVVLAASAASNSKTFYGWLPISIAGTTKWIQMYN